MLIVFFVLDNLLFGFNLALESYFKKIAVNQEEVTSNLSMAQTINHVAAIFVPLVGGLIWEAYGSGATFLGGAIIALVSIVLTQFMGREQPTATQPVVS